VREIAREHIQSGHDDIRVSILRHFSPGPMNDRMIDPWIAAVTADVEAATVTVTASWPGEQPQDGAVPEMPPVIAMSMRHLLASLNVWRVQACRNSAERDALAARVAELEAEQPRDDDDVRERIAAELDGIAALLEQQAAEVGGNDRTHQTILKLRADTYTNIGASIRHGQTGRIAALDARDAKGGES
jgi:hypothetical protein